MSTLEFISEFRTLHEKAKKGSLSPTERARYENARVQFGRMVVVAQQLGHSGRTLRSNLRMAKMLKAELRPADGDPVKVATIDLSSNGFAALVPDGLAIGATAAFTLHLPSGQGTGTIPISGRVVVASSRPQTGAFRVSFRFENLHPAVQDQLDMALIDAVLERFKTM